ncbi:hypothetical protein FB45DRAFT_1025664 [Roridomyces roridus]|uniref:Uncharacterized protein n=1 Tax=Roridomyces roridus TaxID=1738132 RepID=A0AAD7BZC5_9AGAR|nr:hypothetical protein FB45DRAFT_1025664 [Roridomyces roridus]
MSILPHELLDLIADNLHNDLGSLKACSLTASPFLPSTRYHIFSTIHLLPPNTKSTPPYQKFCSVLHSSPHLALLVKDLRIVEGSRSPSESLGTPWVAAAGRILASILSQLKLSRFTMVSHREAPDYWDTLPRRLITAIQDVFCSPSLKSVRIFGFAHSPLVTLLMGEAYKLKELVIDDSALVQIISFTSRPQLEHLALADSPTSTGLLFALSNIDFSRLKILSLSGLSMDGSSVNSLLTLMPDSNAVETLNIWYKTDIDFGQYPLEPLDIVSSLPRLRFLRVSGQLSILDMAATLAECGLHKTLESISLEAGVDFLQIDDPMHWSEFHAAFLRFPRRIQVALRLAKGQDGYKTSLEERDTIGLLIARGDVIIHESCSYSTLSVHELEP